VERGRIALVSARAAASLDEDLPPLLAALQKLGAKPFVACWDDPQVDWAACELAVLRSTWDYAERVSEFLRWGEHVAALTQLINPLPLVRWNTDKHYLHELARAGVPTVPSHFIEPGSAFVRAIAAFLAAHGEPEVVVKPAVGAGSRDAQRHSRTELAAITSHVRRLLASGRSALLQPYLERVNEQGESALIYLGGRFSHGVRKGPLLQRDAGSTPLLFATEDIRARAPSAAEQQVAEQVLGAMPRADWLYARVDLIRDAADRPCLLELELTEPSLFFQHAPHAAERLAQLILDARA
jgi:glutathione synthase/RimK-type ligase-like ATP-grasp enzyme